jgi:hypothetical protein
MSSSWQAIGLQYESDDLDIDLIRQTAGILLRHRALDPGEQIGHGSARPALQKYLTGKRWRALAARELRHVAAGAAILQIAALPAGGL